MASNVKLLKNEPEAQSQIVTHVNNLMNFVILNSTKVIYGVGCFLFILLIGIGVWYFGEKAELKAFDLLEQARSKHLNLWQADPTNAYQKIKDDYKRIFDKYGTTVAARFAHLTYGNICFEAQAYDEAIIHYNKTLTDFENDTVFLRLGLSGLAHTYLKKKDFSNAIAYFKKIADGSSLFLKDEALFHLGLLYEKTEQNELSQRMYESLSTFGQNSIYKEIVDGKLNHGQ